MVAKRENEMKIKKVYRILLWMGKATLPNMKELDMFEWNKLDFEEGYTFSFNGQRANVFTFSIDTEVTREMALECATKFMDGNYDTITIDLNRCTGSATPGTTH